VKVLDFGLVKEVSSRETSLSEPNTVAGTPLYMAPETIAHPEVVDLHVDIYALGAVGYFLLTGEPPFVGKSTVDVYHGHVYENAATPSERLGRPVPVDLESLVMACLAKSPADRPANAGALADTLAGLQLAHPWKKTEARAWWQARSSGKAVIGDPHVTDGLGTTALTVEPR
jgi:serine/threonine protein kinase